MLFRKRTSVFLSLAVSLSTLTACANSPSAKNLEQSLAADPQLQNGTGVLQENQAKSLQPAPNQSSAKLPADFPQDIPIYPNSTLEEVTPPISPDNKISTRWQNSDPSNFIASFYRSQFSQKNWQVLQQPAEDDVAGSFIAQHGNLLVTVAIQPQSVTKATPNQPQTSTILKIDYTTQSSNTAKADPDHNSVNLPQPGDPAFIGPVLPNENQPRPSTNSTDNNNQVTSTSLTNSQNFIDLNQAPPEWRQHLQDLATLGVLSIEPRTTNQFLPNKIITRREYARWLVATNNTLYANNPAKQIRLGVESNQSTFKDVSPKDADFPAIQGLAEAGLIPSLLSGDTTSILFHPDAPLTREEMLLWKVPLDIRQALPNANLEAVKQTWGFQDAEKIEPKALRAILGDFQNGEQANIRRVFGYTTLFQPRKPVTRAEAATTLWYFGTPGEGISASEGLKLKG